MPRDHPESHNQENPVLNRKSRHGEPTIAKGEKALRRTRLGLALFIAGLAVLLVLAAFAALTRPAQAAGGAAASSAVFFENPYSGALLEASALSADLSVRGDGALVHTTLRQTFVNRASRALPGIYIIRLSAEARLESITLYLAGEASPGAPLSSQRLAALYDQASGNLRLAALLPSSRTLLHAVRLPSLAPGQIITLEVQFAEPERLTGGG